MTGPENAEVAVDVEGATWVLRYPCGAVHALQTALGEPGDVMSAVGLIDKLEIQNLSTFVWAGLLHENRQMDLDKVKQTVEWGHTPVADWALAVRTAWNFAVEGSIGDPELPPGKPGAMNRRLGRSWRRLWSLVSGSRRESSGGTTPSPTAEADSSPAST